MKKFIVALFVAALVFTGTASSVSAASGWQTLVTFRIANFDNYPFESYESNSRTSGIVYTKDGGNIGLKVTDHFMNAGVIGYDSFMKMDVYEDDGATGDDYIGTYVYFPHIHGTEIFTVPIGAYEDGANGQAEIYVKIKASYNASPFYFSVLD